MHIIALIIGIVGSLLAWLFAVIVWTPARTYYWFRDTKPPEPSYDPSVRVRKDVLAPLLAALLFTAWIIAIIAQAYQRITY